MTDRVAIVGARDASPETLEQVRAYVRGLPEGTVVVSGGAAGVDEAAAVEAHRAGLSVEEYLPAYARMVVSAVDSWGVGDVLNLTKKESPRDLLLARNTLIAIRCTRMVAFVQGSKGGTWDSIKQAERFKRPVEVIR